MPNHQGKLALVIEDDSMSIKVLERLLSQQGVEVISIKDSYTIFQTIETLERRIDVIFLDLEMPQNNGYTVLDHLRSIERFKAVPIVAYTTHTSHLNEARGAGFHSFLGKPLDSRSFAHQLADILSNIPVWEVP